MEQRVLLSTYTVTTLADPGSGGTVSLRQAITAANAAGGANVIDFAGGLTGTIDLAAVLPTITGSLTIDGPGASLLTINAHGYGSVLTFKAGTNGVSSTVDGLTLTGGSGPAYNGYSTDGGGGIANQAEALTVSNCVITGNTSASDGGGIANENFGGSSMQVINCTITGNTAAACGGGITDGYDMNITITGCMISGNTAGNEGGGIGPDSGFGCGKITVTNCTINGNTALYGGGIYGGRGTPISYGTSPVTLTGCVVSANMAKGNANSSGGGVDTAYGVFTNTTISGNSATKSGGGVYSSGTLVVNDSTVNGNAAASGGGVYDNSNALSTSVANSTFTANTATTTGGGIDNEAGTLTITDSTLSGNSAATAGGGVYSYVSASSAGTLNGTIVAANTGSDLTPKSGFFSGANDLIGDGSDQGALSNTQRGSSSVLLSPGLSPLGNFGGPTQTMALLPGSVAIDNGAAFSVLDSNNNNITATDQRGIARPQGLAPDIGAFESQNLPAGPGTQLAFAQQPGSAQAGIAVAPAIVIDILDANGNLATTDNSMVTLAVAAGPVGAIAGGTAAVQAVNGVATFSNLLVLSTIPGAVTLQASDGTLGTATSASFNVSLPYTPTTIQSVSTTAAASSRYGVNGSVPITLNLSGAVTVSGAPQLLLSDGALAIYRTGNGTSSLNFTYVVSSGENTTDLDYASIYALGLAGGSIIDGAGHPILPTLPAIGTDGLATKNIVIDTVAPTVTSVSTTAAAGSRFKAGGSISVKIALGESVTVTGTPQLLLNDGGAAVYASGSGTSTLTFTYAVAAGQNTTDLDYASPAALVLNGGSIADLAGNAGVLTLPATGTDGLATQNLIVDTTAPTVAGTSASEAANSRFRTGGVVPITITFAEPVNVTGTPHLTLNDTAVVNYSSGSGTSTLTFNYTVAAGQNTAGLDYASITALALNGGTIKDLAGNAATLTLPATGTDGLATLNLVIDTTAPKVNTVSTTVAANTTCTVGATVPIVVTFSEPVTVTGTPQITLNDNGLAHYTSGSGGSTITFTYIVALGENASNLDYGSISSLDPNGGSIADLAGNATALALPAIGTDGLATQHIVVDTNTPAIAASPASQGVIAGQATTFTAAAYGSPTPAVQWQLSVDGGKTFNDIGGAISTTLAFTASADQAGNQYRAVFTNSHGSATTTPATLSVLAGVVGGTGAAFGLSGPVGSQTLSVTAGTVSVNLDVAATLPNTGISIGSGATVLFTASQTLVILSLADGGAAKLQASGTPLLKLGSLSLTGSAMLDLGSGGIAIGYGTGASPYAQVKTWITNARGSGNTWAGSGITSSAAAANSSQVTLGYAEASDANPAGGLFLGQSVDTAHSVLVRATWWGDGNLDGKVNGRDFLAMTAAALFNKGPSALATWYNGDYTGDGKVNGQDFLKMTAAGKFNKETYDSTVTAAVTPAVVSAEATGATPAVQSTELGTGSAAAAVAPVEVASAVGTAAQAAVEAAGTGAVAATGLPPGPAAVALSGLPRVVTYAAPPAARGRGAAEPVAVPVSAGTLAAFARGGAVAVAEVGVSGVAWVREDVALLG